MQEIPTTTTKFNHEELFYTMVEIATIERLEKAGLFTGSAKDFAMESLEREVCEVYDRLCEAYSPDVVDDYFEWVRHESESVCSIRWESVC